MRGRYEELSCPFCDKGKIKCWYIPGAWSIRQRKTASLPGTKAIKKSADVWIIKSGCPVCGKSQEEVERKLKEEKII
jgi:hypothetical protein